MSIPDRRNRGGVRDPDESRSEFFQRMRAERAEEYQAATAAAAAASEDVEARARWCWGFEYGGHWVAQLWTKPRCRECDMTYNRSAVRKHRHGITDREVHSRVDEQGGRCPICLNPYDEKVRLPSVDHIHRPGEKPNNRSPSHERGPQRDVICQACNFMLGNAMDDPQALRRGADYLDRWARTAASGLML